MVKGADPFILATKNKKILMCQNNFYTQLPTNVQSLWDEVSVLTGKDIVTIQGSTIEGDATFNEEHPFIQIIYRDILTPELISHELLHLKYIELGFLPLLILEETGHIKKIIDLLQNLIHHRVISSELERLGYPPATEQSPSIGIQLTKLEAISHDLDTVIEKDSKLKQYFATIYARAKLENTNPKNDKRLEAIYNNGELKEIREKMGERLVDTIKTSDVSTVSGYEKTLQGCVQILELQNEIHVEHHEPRNWQLRDD